MCPTTTFLSSRLLDQAPQSPGHHVFEFGRGEAGTAELQLGDEAPEEGAALLYG